MTRSRSDKAIIFVNNLPCWGGLFKNQLKMSIRWEKTAVSKVFKEQRHVSGFSDNHAKRGPYIKKTERLQYPKQKENTTPTTSIIEMNYIETAPTATYDDINGKKKHKRTASLTDLRPEDKKKVANLIQELASLGAQKNEIEEKLKKERNDFESAIKDLVTDQKALLLERQAVQSELNSCQQMLNQLQEAVLHRPTSSSQSLRSQRIDDEQHSSSVVPDKRHADFDRHSALEEYISKHGSTQESMEVASDVESIVSDAVRNPRLVKCCSVTGSK